MNIYEKALLIRKSIINHRRYLHTHAECGLNLPISVKYISDTLNSLGLAPERCGHGIIATVGHGEKCVLLRADADALPMKEESEEDFSSRENVAHCCGHDIHSAMLLGCAELLSEMRNSLQCKVILMFQSGEEELVGCRDMIKSGLFERYSPSAAFALHTAAGSIVPGTYFYNAGGTMMRSADFFEIKIYGHGGHGAYSELTVNPIRIACKIHSFIDTLVKHNDKNQISIGCISAGNAANIIPSEALIRGSIRCTEAKMQKQLRTSLSKGVYDIASKAGAKADIYFTASVPPLVCEKDLTLKACEYIKSCGVPVNSFIDNLATPASDDFALITERIPSTYIYLSAGFSDERGKYLAHDPRVCFNEDVCAIGTAVYTAFATNFSNDCTSSKNIFLH